MKEFWKIFNSDKYIYECSNLGRFRRKCKTKYSYLKPYLRNCYEYHEKIGKQNNHKHTVIIKITTSNGPKEYNCKSLLAKLFIRDLKSNEIVIVKNNNNFDLKVENLFITTKSNLGSITGGKSSKSHKIYSYDNRGFRTSYSSVRSCAAALGISYQTVLDYLKGKRKSNKYNFELAKEVN